MVVAGFTGFNLAEAGGFGGQMSRPGGTRPFMPFVDCLPSRRRPVFDEILSRYPEANIYPRISTNSPVALLRRIAFRGGVLLVGFPHLTLLLYFQNRVHVVFIACSKSIYDLRRREVIATFEKIDHNV